MTIHRQTASQPESHPTVRQRAVHRFGIKAPTAQPLEPILFPKLRIYFADFPSCCATAHWNEAE